VAFDDWWQAGETTLTADRLLKAGPFGAVSDRSWRRLLPDADIVTAHRLVSTLCCPWPLSAFRQQDKSWFRLCAEEPLRSVVLGRI
jgi:hypothetical protein